MTAVAGAPPVEQHARRRQITEVLLRHGLGYVVGIVGLERFVPFHRGLLGHPRRTEPYTRPEHLRMALEDLGATAVKLGQIASTRTDLLPPDHARELAKLQDQVPPEPFEAIRGVIETELGQRLEELFASFDPVPIAAGSIGQAHSARLRDGTDAVVKVRRPGVVEQVEQDLQILQTLAAATSRRWERASELDLVGLADEFGRAIRAELDYVREARNAERFARNYADDPAVHVPAVFWDTTSSRVLTLERIGGIKIDDVAALDAAAIDRPALAERAARVVLKMVFADRFFHADPHPGNFFVEPGGRIGLIDMGMVGSLDDRTAEQLGAMLIAISRSDADLIVDGFLELGVARRRVDRERLREDVEHILGPYYGRPLGEITIGPLLREVFDIVRRHHLRLPRDLALLLKTLIMNEALGATIDPGFRLAAVLEPYARELTQGQLSPRAWATRMGRAGLDAALLGPDLPRRLHRLLTDLERGGVEIGMRPVGFEDLVRRIERLGDRIVLGVIAAALLSGLAMLVSAYRPSGAAAWTAVALAQRSSSRTSARRSRPSRTCASSWLV